jgi:glutathione synthase
MKLWVAVQMDPIENVNIDADSTFALALEAQHRGYRLHHYFVQDMSLYDQKLTTMARPLEVRRQKGNHYTLGDYERIDLAETDVVLMRQDPPFNMHYITATHLLEHIHPKTLVVNDPVNVRNAPEKLFVTHFKGLMPPTLITTRPDDVRAFRTEHKDIIIKPLYGNGGEGVFRIREDDENLNSLLELYARLYKEPAMVQQYLPDVRRGDKRIILVDGKPVGALNRVPSAGESRSNLHVGGRAESAELTARDHEICEAIGPTLKAQGLIFVGIDVIGDYLTEINVTSPTGIQEIGRFDGTNIPGLIWDAIESRL